MEMHRNMVAKVSQTIDSPVAVVWRALMDPVMTTRYMFGTTVTSDWKVGSTITWEGEWKGKPYKDHGQILVVEERRRLVYTHFSPLSAKPDIPENHHTIIFELESSGKRTKVTLSQDNNHTKHDCEYAERNWQMVLEKLKGILEG